MSISLSGKMRPLTRDDFDKRFTQRMMLSSVMIPSQYQAYSICVEFARDWFLEKFNPNFFNNVHVDGKFAFDDFNRFSITDDKLKRVNPLLAIFPTIQMDHNRNWIDSNPEIPLMLRRTKMEGCFFNDMDRGSHVQIIFKTILMNFTFKMRVNTRAEQLDLLEAIKIKHRAGYTESRDISMDIHVPKDLIAQIAFDAGFEFDENLNIKTPIPFLTYLNKNSYIPFLYKLRCVNGNSEFFIKVPNCVAHLRIEMPTYDDGERMGVNSTNYTIDLNVEIEMTAPHSYTYYSQYEHKYINTGKISVDGMVSVMASTRTVIPQFDEHHWPIYTTLEYMVEDSDIGTSIAIDFTEVFSGTDLQEVLAYTKQIAINPFICANLKFFNNGTEMEYEMDWKTYQCKLKAPLTNNTVVIGVYMDLGYINNTLITIKDLQSQDTRVE